MRSFDSLSRIATRALLLASLALLSAGPGQAAGATAAAQPAPSAAADPAIGAPDRVFKTSRTLAAEVKATIQFLQGLHYNRDAVKEDTYKQVVPDFMGDLDSQRLFFLAADKTAFVDKYAANLYWNAVQLGNIESAYDIYNVYARRATARVNWVLNELNKDFDLTTDETYQIDRSKAEWPATAAEADDLWRRRLKSELVVELLGQESTAAKAAAAANGTPKEGPGKTAAPALSAADAKKKAMDAAKVEVRKRYERVLRNIGEMEGSDIAELFLTTIANLFDPHSNYFSPDSLEDFGITMKLTLYGIGAVLESKDDYCVVKEIVPGAPAELSGLIHPNDKIVAVAQVGGEPLRSTDPVDIFGMRLRKIVQMIRGDAGTKVRLTIQPDGTSDSSARKDIVLTRDRVKLNNARAHGAIFEVPGDGGTLVPLGVITIPTFYGDSGDDEGEKFSLTRDVAELIKRLQAGGVKGIVLDLRNNGGGFLNEAIDLTGLFISKGPVVQIKQYDGRIGIDADDDPAVAYGGPLAVLVNRFSASASEIVAGALQNYGRAIIVGDSSTHGKGTVQTILEMKDRLGIVTTEKTGAVKLTIQKFYLPNGSSTQLRGVVPDIVLPSIDDYIPDIGESDLPHALVWDDIKSSVFDGKPVDTSVLKPLLDASRARQALLPEFGFLGKNVDWFKNAQAQKTISLNLAVREKQRASDDAFRAQMKVERDLLAKNDYSYEEVRLVPKPPAPIRAASADEDPLADDAADAADAYTKVDIPLRESFRVVEDYLSALAKVAPAPAATAPSASSADRPAAARSKSG